MAFCTNCGQQLADNTKFCAGCGTPCNAENPVNNKRKTVYDGEIHKCPNCGEILPSFTVNCPSCGFEIRNIRATTSVQEFARKLEQIEQQRKPIKNSLLGLKQKLNDQMNVNSIDEQKISLIRNFIIPNTKEDLLEFLVLASSNINLQRYNDFDQITESQKAVSDAWQAKFEQAYQKAKLSYGDSPDFKRIQVLYEQKSRQIHSSKKKRVYFWIGYAALFVVVFAVIIGGAALLLSSDSKKIESENDRLNEIVAEIYSYIEEENYTLARSKAAMLVFSGSTSKEGNQAAEKWNITRNELLDIIDNAEHGISGEISITADIQTFTYGYAQADFSKYNSNASENGLDGTKVYIIGKLDKTEILEADGTESILGYFTDEKNNCWIIQMHIIPLVDENYYSSAVGKNIVLRGVYSGFSGTERMPVIVLDELLICETSATLVGMQKLLDE